ncbi:hypothetical protein CYMTET_2668 [Cymbomonas tetramitiformis]|uniref:Uncharacterized protein n=1 Tax=Cymbomonas tetramitiformis TaxID=36881 RepID=A0AAE0LMC4_9CHLO|nr:hypothetical protein CYMTET_2668 [Cymbomonas tetramitiformis]
MTTRVYELSTLMLACIDGAVGVRADVRSKLRVYAEQFYDFMRGCNMATRLRLLEAAERHLLSSMRLALSAESNMLEFVGDCFEPTHIKHSEDCVRREVTQTILAAFCAQIGMNALRALVEEYGCAHCATSEVCVALVHIYDLSYTELRSVRDLLGSRHAVYGKLLPVIAMNPKLTCADKLDLNKRFRHEDYGDVPYACRLIGQYVTEPLAIASMCRHFNTNRRICNQIVVAHVNCVKLTYDTTMSLWHALGVVNEDTRKQLVVECLRVCDLSKAQTRAVRRLCR